MASTASESRDCGRGSAPSFLVSRSRRSSPRLDSGTKLHNDGATPPPVVESAGGISLAAFAMERGIAKDTARRLVKSGKLRAHQVVGIHGPEWCVHPDNRVAHVNDVRSPCVAPEPGMRRGPGAVVPGSDLAGLVALVDRLTTENRELAEVAAVWRERARMLEERLAQVAPPSPVEVLECAGRATRGADVARPVRSVGV